jgi:hypothetical protein
MTDFKTDIKKYMQVITEGSANVGLASLANRIEQMIRDIASSDAAPEHKKAAIDALLNILHAENKENADESRYEDEYDAQFEDDNESFFVAIANGNTTFVGAIEKDGNKWTESHSEYGTAPYGWGGKRYMGYLTPDDLMSYLRSDYGTVTGPYHDAQEALDSSE